MTTDRRRAAATAGLGYGLVGAGGVIRGHAIDAAHGAIGRDTTRMRPSSLAVYRAAKLRLPAGPRLVRRWGGGTALITVGAPAAAKGTADLFHRRRKVTKRDRRPNLVRESVAGTTEAWQDKAAGFRSGAPLSVRAVPVGVGAGAGAAGSLAAHRALDLFGRHRRIPPRLRHGVTAVAAVPAVVASLPVSRRITRRRGYTPQASGGLKPVSKLAPRIVYHGTTRLGARGIRREGFRGEQTFVTTNRRTAAGYAKARSGGNGKGRVIRRAHVGPADSYPLEQFTVRSEHLAKAVAKLYVGRDYRGRHLSSSQQRLRIYAAGSTPVVGPAAAVRQAGRYAPPGHERSAMTRQAVGGPGAAAAGGVAGAYGLAHLAEHNPVVARHTQRVAQAGEDLKSRGLRAVGIEREARSPGELGSLARRAATTRVGRPLFSSRRRAIGAVVGYTAGKAIAGQVGGNVAISRNVAAQRRYNAAHTHFTKAAPMAMTSDQARVLARRKRRSARLSEVGGAAGLTALGLQVATRRPRLHPDAVARMLAHRDTALTVGAGVGGFNALTSAAIQRREAKAIHKSLARAVFVKNDLERRRAQRNPAEAHRSKYRRIDEVMENFHDSIDEPLVHMKTAGIVKPREDMSRHLSGQVACGSEMARHVTTEHAKVTCPECLSRIGRLRVIKRANDPVRTTMTDAEAHKLVHGTGGYRLTGSLPSHLDRQERMRAYEARYLAAGGKHREHWARRARGAEVARNVGVAGGTMAGAAWLAADSPRVRGLVRATRAGRAMAGRVGEHRVKHAAERGAVGAATLAGGAELSGEYARRKRGSYSSAPAGVAASALRRMQSYSP